MIHRRFVLAASVALIAAAVLFGVPAAYAGYRPELLPEWKPVFADPPVPMDSRQNSWRMLGPLAVLAVLAQHPGRVVHVFPPPPGWIGATDVDLLRGLVEVPARAAVVCPYRFPDQLQARPAPGATSTVGREARRLLAAGGGGWPSACSDVAGDSP